MAESGPSSFDREIRGGPGEIVDSCRTGEPRGTRASALGRRSWKVGQPPSSWHLRSPRRPLALVGRLARQLDGLPGRAEARRVGPGAPSTSKETRPGRFRGSVPNTEGLRRATLRDAHRSDDAESETDFPSRGGISPVRMMRTLVSLALPVTNSGLALPILETP